MVVVGSLITWSGAPGILGVVEEVEGQRRVVVLFDDGERRTLTIETVEPMLYSVGDRVRTIDDQLGFVRSSSERNGLNWYEVETLKSSRILAETHLRPHADSDPAALLAAGKLSSLHEKEPRNLAGAARFYLQREMPDVHTSETDARATLDILSAQVQRYPDVPEDVSALHEFCNPVNPDAIDPEGKFGWMNGRPSIAFGKHKGRSLQELATEPEPNYLHWILDGDFSREVKEIVHAALRGEFPKPPESVEP